MKKYVYVFILTILANSLSYAETFNCLMSYRNIDSSGQLIELSQEMMTTAEDAQIQLLEGHLQERSFYVIWYKNNLDGFFQIINPTDSDQGIVLKSGLDMESRVRITEVKSSTTYQLSCQYN